MRLLGEAHSHASHNRTKIEKSDLCGCFYCLKIYHPREIQQWIDEGIEGETAVCPECCVDAVLPGYSGLPITKKFLQQMHEQWFGSTLSLGSVVVEI